jgi:hypothetical protein
VTENVKDFRPLLQRAYADGEALARLLLVPPDRFPRRGGDRNSAIAAALFDWLATAGTERPDED